MVLANRSLGPFVMQQTAPVTGTEKRDRYIFAALRSRENEPVPVFLRGAGPLDKGRVPPITSGP